MTTPRETEYELFCEFWRNSGFPPPVSLKNFDLLEWLHSKDRVLILSNTNPKPSLRHYTSEERKGMPIYSGVMMYFPDALAAISRVSKACNDKHNPGEPLHWARGKSTDQMDCAARHMLTPEEPDTDSNEPELTHAAWRILAQLQLAEEKRLVAAGIKPLSGVVQ